MQYFALSVCCCFDSLGPSAAVAQNLHLINLGAVALLQSLSLFQNCGAERINVLPDCNVEDMYDFVFF